MAFDSVKGFVDILNTAAPKSNKNFESKRRIEKIYLNAPVNYGRYQVLPLLSSITDFPFVELPYTREINIPRKNIKSDGTENIYKAWIKLLPVSAYMMKDETGRKVSSLTAADEKLLHQAYAVYDELFNELNAKEDRADHVINLIRRKNYTIFHAYCINRWTLDNARTPERQNFSGLFVVTSKKFSEALSENMTQFGMIEGVGDEWLNSVYNNKLSGRDGFLMFTVQRNTTGAPGFQFSINHAINKGEYLKTTEIPAEDAELMKDPVESFLGWQANREGDDVPVGKKHLFNAKLVQEAINFMTDQLSSVRMAKQNNTDIAAAIEATNQQALNVQRPTNTMGQETNDPMLANMAAEATKAKMNQNMAANPQKIVQNNTAPFETPAAAHFDPTGNIKSDDSKPSFGGNFGNSSNNDLPF